MYNMKNPKTKKTGVKCELHQPVTMVLVLLLFWFCPICNAGTIERYVDPDAVGGGTGIDLANAYTSLQTCLDTEARDLTNNGGDTFIAYVCSTGGTDDTTPVVISSSWGTNEAYDITVIQTDFPTNGIWDDSKYILSTTNNVCISLNKEVYMTVENMQILVNGSGSSYAMGVYVPSGISTCKLYFDSCIVKGNSTTTQDCYGFRLNDSSVTTYIYNCLIYGFVNENDPQHYGIWADSVATVYIYNSTIFNNYLGINQDSGSVVVKNTVSCNNYDDFEGSFTTIDYCASDDGDGTNGVDWDAEATDWAAAFTDYSSGDFSVKDTDSDLYDAGTSDPGSGLYSDDIIGTTRTTWDVGAFEFKNAAKSRKKGRIAIINFN